MSGRKINFCRKYAIKILRTTVANADTERLKSLHILFDTYLDHMLTKIEPDRIVQNGQKFENFDKQSTFLKPFSTRAFGAI